MTASILKSRICQIMDLEEPAALDEARRKLTGTIMLVNGILVQILAFDWDRNIVIVCDYKGSLQDRSSEMVVKTLEVFLPDTGLYLSNEIGWLYVEKIPVRQWAKSCIGDGYRVIPLRPDIRANWKMLLDLKSTEKKDIIITPERWVYHHKHKIGMLGDNRIICNSSLFQQELNDWIRDEV